MRPLDGIRVLEIGHFIAAPYCTLLLADCGCEVIKIEKPLVGDPRRSYDPLFKRNGQTVSGGFIGYNRGKKSLTLDLKTAGGAELLAQLLKRCDVLVENMKPGALERLGFGKQRVRELNPRLIYCAISGYGRLRQGPLTDFPAFDVPIQAMSGIMHMLGDRDGPPRMATYGFADIYTGVLSALAICIGLYRGSARGVACSSIRPCTTAASRSWNGR